jgi:hypothetical protein
MTIKPCRECKAPISTRAVSCPHCGARGKPSFAVRMFKIALGMMLMIVGLLFIMPLAGILAVSFMGGH